MYKNNFWIKKWHKDKQDAKKEACAYYNPETEEFEWNQKCLKRFNYVKWRDKKTWK